jgi:hypothetical protein
MWMARGDTGGGFEPKCSKVHRCITILARATDPTKTMNDDAPRISGIKSGNPIVYLA